MGEVIPLRKNTEYCINITLKGPENDIGRYELWTSFDGWQEFQRLLKLNNFDSNEFSYFIETYALNVRKIND